MPSEDEETTFAKLTEREPGRRPAGETVPTKAIQTIRLSPTPPRVQPGLSDPAPILPSAAPANESANSFDWLDETPQSGPSPRYESLHYPGEVIDGCHRLKRMLGKGGFGEVWLAESKEWGRVAIKLPRQRANLKNEAKNASRLKHDNIVPVYSWGEHQGTTYIVSQFISGETLEARIKRGCVRADFARKVVIGIAEALSYARELGMIHRDLKPANILIDRRDHVYLTDFGIARNTWEWGRYESGGTGTRDYMAPEHMEGKTIIDGRGDIFALGVVLFEMLTGHLPYEGGRRWWEARMGGKDPPWLSSRTDYPKELWEVARRCLAMKPFDRFATAEALLVSLNIPRKPPAATRPAECTSEELLSFLKQKTNKPSAPSKAAAGVLTDAAVEADVTFQLTVDRLASTRRETLWWLPDGRRVAFAVVVFSVMLLGLPATGMMKSLFSRINEVIQRAISISPSRGSASRFSRGMEPTDCTREVLSLLRSDTTKQRTIDATEGKSEGRGGITDTIAPA